MTENPYDSENPRAKWECQTCGYIRGVHPDCLLTSRPSRLNCRGCGPSDNPPIRTFKCVGGTQTRGEIAKLKTDS